MTKLLTTAEVADRLSIPIERIRDLVDKGLLTPIMVGARSDPELLAFIEDNCE